MIKSTIRLPTVSLALLLHLCPNLNFFGASEEAGVFLDLNEKC